MSGENLDRNEQNSASENATTGPTNTSGGQTAFDPKAVLTKAIEVVQAPKTIWSTIKADKTSIADTYRSYVLPLAAIPVIANFIGMVFVGMDLPFIGSFRWPFFSGLVSSVISYAVSVAFLYAAAHVSTFLAPKFGASISLENSFKAVAYSMTPAYLVGVCYVIPSLGVLTFFAGIYALYMFFHALSAMSDTPAASGGVFFGATIVGNIVVGFCLGLLVVAFTPSAPLPSFDGLKNIKLGEKVTIDPNEIQKSINHFQNAFGSGAGQ